MRVHFLRRCILFLYNNLPEDRQSAIERHLKIQSFPTYKLFNRNGELLDLHVDPRELESLARLMEQMK